MGEALCSTRRSGRSIPCRRIECIAFRRQHVLKIAHARTATLVDDELAVLDTDVVGPLGLVGGGQDEIAKPATRSVIPRVQTPIAAAGADQRAINQSLAQRRAAATARGALPFDEQLRQNMCHPAGHFAQPPFDRLAGQGRDAGIACQRRRLPSTGRPDRTSAPDAAALRRS